MHYLSLFWLEALKAVTVNFIDYILGIEISHKLSHSWIYDNNGTFWYLLKDIREIFRKFLMVNVRFITKL